jgi:hypothetical protein
MARSKSRLTYRFLEDKSLIKQRKDRYLKGSGEDFRTVRRRVAAKRPACGCCGKAVYSDPEVVIRFFCRCDKFERCFGCVRCLNHCAC